MRSAVSATFADTDTDTHADAATNHGRIMRRTLCLMMRVWSETSGRLIAAGMRSFVPHDELTVRIGLDYSRASTPHAGSRSTRLDVFTPASAAGAQLPTVIWLHGGAWISGDKRDVDPYLRILAASGYTTVGVNYALGPEGKHPDAMVQLNDAFAYLSQNAAELGIDLQQLIIAGDSAGAQLASSYAAAVTSPDAALAWGISPTIAAGQLAGVILHCGVFDVPALSRLRGIESRAFGLAMWAYTGANSHETANAHKADAAARLMSSIHHVDRHFPPTFISGGNVDALTDVQSHPFRNRLHELGVAVDELFWPADSDAILGHEYQFRLRRPEAQTALRRTLEFLAARTSRAATRAVSARPSG